MRAAAARRAAAAKGMGVVQFVEGARELSLSLEEEGEEGAEGKGEAAGGEEVGQLKLTRGRMGGGGPVSSAAAAVSSHQHHHHHHHHVGAGPQGHAGTQFRRGSTKFNSPTFSDNNKNGRPCSLLLHK